MITSKQRAALRKLANTAPAILQLGKEGIGEALVRQVDEALEARELVKLHVLETAPVGTREAAQQLALATRADIVQVIGSRFSLYRRNEQRPQLLS